VEIEKYATNTYYWYLYKKDVAAIDYFLGEVEKMTRRMLTTS